MSASYPDIELRLVSDGHIAFPRDKRLTLPRALFRSWDERDSTLRRIALQSLNIALPPDMHPKFVGLFKDPLDGSAIAHYQVDMPATQRSEANDTCQWVRVDDICCCDVDAAIENRLSPSPLGPV